MSLRELADELDPPKLSIFGGLDSLLVLPPLQLEHVADDPVDLDMRVAARERHLAASGLDPVPGARSA